MSKDNRIKTTAGVRAKLKSSQSPDAALILDLIDTRRVGAFGSRLTGNHFSASNGFKPVWGSKISPFRDLPPPEDVGDILLSDLNTAEENDVSTLVYHPAQASPEGDKMAATELINHITDPLHKTEGCIATLWSPALDAMCKGSAEALFETPVSCSVLPSEHAIELQHHNESISTLTLLTGTIAWVVWPATETNLNVLQNAYENFEEDLNPARLDIARHLEHGITFVQQRGETLKVAPWTIMMGVALETSVIASKSVVTLDNFLAMCRHIPFYKSWWKTEVKSDEKQGAFSSGIVACIMEILEGDFDDLDIAALTYPLTTNGALSALLAAWDEIKADIIDIMDTDTAARLKQAWVEFLSHGAARQCLLCGVQYRKEKGKQYGNHFLEKHWISVALRSGRDGLRVRK